MAHVDQALQLTYVLGNASDAEVAKVERHLDTCADCRGSVATLAAKYETQPNLEPAPSFEPGELIDGRYKLKRLIGKGAMGSVFEAHHIHLNRSVALKFMAPGLTKNPVAARRFQREARSVVRLSTPHVCRVTDLGILPSGIAYLAMEYLQGETLQERLERGGRLPIHEALEYVRDAARGLEAAHAIGITHRDVKPQNLFLTKEGTSTVLKVLDFGVARSINPEIEKGLGKISSPQVVLGSPMFMAPEQLSGATTSAVDIWALGVVLFELLTGQLPFVADSLVALSALIRNQPPTPIRKLLPNVPARVEEIVTRCLQKRPDRRYASMRELREALDAALTNQPSPTVGGPSLAVAGIGTAASFLAALFLLPTHEATSMPNGAWKTVVAVEHRELQPTAPAPAPEVKVEEEEELAPLPEPVPKPAPKRPTVKLRQPNRRY